MTLLAFPGRPDEWELALFLHVLGAILLFGGVASAIVLEWASFSRPASAAAMLRRLAFRTTLIVVWPSFILMRIAGEWIASKEFQGAASDPDWIVFGYVIGDGGVLVLIGLTLCTWLAARERNALTPRPATATIAAGIAGVYLVALAVAWWAMTAKPG